jgi:hypothetical protein
MGWSGQDDDLRLAQQALCTICLADQARRLHCTVKLGKDNSPSSLMDHMRVHHQDETMQLLLPIARDYHCRLSPRSGKNLVGASCSAILLFVRAQTTAQAHQVLHQVLGMVQVPRCTRPPWQDAPPWKHCFRTLLHSNLVHLVHRGQCRICSRLPRAGPTGRTIPICSDARSHLKWCHHLPRRLSKTWSMSSSLPRRSVTSLASRNTYFPRPPLYTYW